MKSFDESLKYLLHDEPVAFIRFAMGDGVPLVVIKPVATALPARGREVDGGYVVRAGGREMVVHIEFHRRNQRSEELDLDVGEAQLRLYRRERLPVLSHVWDLYGHDLAPLLTPRRLHFGVMQAEAGPDPTAAGSQVVYHRVNLRALGAEELLERASPVLWPLVPLTRGGHDEDIVARTCSQIAARPELSAPKRADHLAVLWFIAEAENVPEELLRALITEERLMEGTLYQSILAKGEARGRAEGEAQMKVDTILRVLAHRLGAVPPAVRERLERPEDPARLSAWFDEALVVLDAAAAQRLADQIAAGPRSR